MPASCFAFFKIKYPDRLFMGCSGLGNTSACSLQYHAIHLEEKMAARFFFLFYLHGALCGISAFLGVSPVE